MMERDRKRDGAPRLPGSAAPGRDRSRVSRELEAGEREPNPETWDRISGEECTDEPRIRLRESLLGPVVPTKPSVQLPIE